MWGNKESEVSISEVNALINDRELEEEIGILMVMGSVLDYNIKVVRDSASVYYIYMSNEFYRFDINLEFNVIKKYLKSMTTTYAVKDGTYDYATQISENSGKINPDFKTPLELIRKNLVENGEGEMTIEKIFGTMNIIHTYHYYDQPLFYLFEDANNKYYIAEALEEDRDEGYSINHYTPIDMMSLYWAVLGRKDISRCILEPRCGWFYRVKYYHRGIHPIEIERVKTSWYKENASFLSLNYYKTMDEDFLSFYQEEGRKEEIKWN